jgi:hypothetical protein
MDEKLLLVAFLGFTAGYIFKSLMYGFKALTASASFVQKIGYRAMILLGTTVYKVSYVDQICAIALEKAGKQEDAKCLRLKLKQEFDDWKSEACKEFKENYPENYKWQLEFDDWKGMMDELTDIYKERKV